MSLPDKRSSYMEPSSPIGRTQLGLAAPFVTPSQKKTDGKADRVVDEEPYIDERKLLSTTAAKGDLTNGPSLKKTDGNGDRVVNDKPFINKRKPSSTSAVKGNLNNGEHTLIPVMVKMIHSADWECVRLILNTANHFTWLSLLVLLENSMYILSMYKSMWKMAQDLWG